jgi:uncharacterized protein Smg (DUF494 family)
MGKKKKAQAPARGYATTSNAKKVEETKDDKSRPQTPSPTTKRKQGRKIDNEKEKNAPESPPQKSREELEYMTLLEKLSSSQNISYLTKQVESNSTIRLSSLPEIRVDQDLEAKLVTLLSCDNDLKSRLYNKVNQSNVNIDKLNKVYLALAEVGFQDTDIQKAMTILHGADFPSLVNWLSFYTPIERLPTGFFDKFYQERNANFFHV